jgi:peptide/nickel transport system permease protein
VISKIKIWHFILLIIALIIIFRFSHLLELINLLFQIIQSISLNTASALAQLNLLIIDSIVSLLLIILLPIIIIISNRLKKLLSQNLRISNSILVILIVFFLFAPLITTQHPDFQKNISVTKLLPPFSYVDYFELNDPSTNLDNAKNHLKKLIDEVIPKSYNEGIVFIDSIKADKEIKYYQAGVLFQIDKNKVKMLDDHPMIKSKLFLLGSDEYGRDVFTRIVYGSRISLHVGLGAVLVSFIIGLSFAFIAVEQGGFVNLFISRITDLFLSFPAIFLVILIIALFGSNIFSIIVVLGFSGWMSLFKVAKSEMLSVKNKEFYLSAKLIGLKNIKLLLREILPAIIIPVSVNLIFQLSNVILAESALSYLGLGTGNEYPSWGAMIEAGQEYISQSWWLIFIPGLILVISLLSINEVGRDINKELNPAIK